MGRRHHGKSANPKGARFHAANLEFPSVIPRFFIYVALFAWLAVFIGLARRLVGVVLIARDPARFQGQAPSPPALRQVNPKGKKKAR